MILDILPAWSVIAFAAVLGALIGSFLNVVVWRLPRGLSVVRPGSACPHCAHPIAWYDNLPVISYLVLRARCRRCAAPISWRYPLVELATAAAFAGVAAGAYLGSYPAAVLPLLLFWAAAAIALTLIDLEHQRLPDAITLPAYAVCALLLAGASVVTGELHRLVPALVGLVAMGGLYLALAVARPGGMGFGDVKLSGSLGLTLGWLGWPQLIVGGFSAFVVGGVVGMVMMAVGAATRRTGIPFGPFMLLGAAIGVYAGPALAGLYLTATGLA